MGYPTFDHTLAPWGSICPISIAQVSVPVLSHDDLGYGIERGGAQEEERLQANQAASPVCPAEFGRDPRGLLRDLHHDVLRLDPSDYR